MKPPLPNANKRKLKQFSDGDREPSRKNFSNLPQPSVKNNTEKDFHHRNLDQKLVSSLNDSSSIQDAFEAAVSP